MFTCEVVPAFHHGASEARGQIASESGIQFGLGTVVVHDALEWLEPRERLVDEPVAETAVAGFSGEVDEPVRERWGSLDDRILGPEVHPCWPGRQCQNSDKYR